MEHRFEYKQSFSRKLRYIAFLYNKKSLAKVDVKAKFETFWGIYWHTTNTQSQMERDGSLT